MRVRWQKTTGVSMDTEMVKRESQISNAFARLDKTIAELESTIPQYEESLLGVLRNEPKLTSNCDVEKKEAQVPLAIVLDKFNDRIYQVIAKLNSMQRRLEL